MILSQFLLSPLQAYALSEMANIERLRNVEQQITSTVDQITSEFKERIQTVLSENQLLLSRNIFIKKIRKKDLPYSSTSASHISTFDSFEGRTTDDE